MASPADLSSHKALDIYYAALQSYQAQEETHEGATRVAFQTLLDTIAPAFGWTLISEKTLTNRARPDGTLKDGDKFPRGHWEAKDTRDDLDVEIAKKKKRGYPLTNIIFEDTRRAVLYQNGREAARFDITQPSQLAALLARFFSHTDEKIEEFHLAVREFENRIPDLARRLQEIIAEEPALNPDFAHAFGTFYEVCKSALNPNLSREAVEEMLVQHLLTERLFRTVYDSPEFIQRNVIAQEIEGVISALTRRAFNRQQWMGRLDYFYRAIEEAARTITDFGEKQGFLNSVYERFFQGWSTRQADTMGIVYTPQPIVDWMCQSCDEVLQSEFGLSLSSRDVKILDPCVGTGNFIVNLLRRVQGRDLAYKYEHDIFCNEVMLLPYYIASLQIEHEFYERTREYRAFGGICFADTLDLNEVNLFSEENTERIKRQKAAKIKLIIGNPPYNVGQANENDNNKNRKYEKMDRRIRETYAKASKATNKNALSDPYVKFFRWASDRLNGEDGIVCFVSNNSFVDGNALDGMRQHLAQDFHRIYHLDLHGNVRRNPKLSGTTHNVFGIQVGVGTTILVRNAKQPERFIKYHRVPETWRKNEKLKFLTDAKSLSGIEWQTLAPDARHNWLTEGMHADFDSFLPLGTKAAKAHWGATAKAIFKNYGRGVATSRDEWVYDWNHEQLAANVQRFIATYNAEVERWQTRDKTQSTGVDDFVTYDDSEIKWSESLKANMARGSRAVFDESKIRPSMYRPFCKQFLFFDRLLNERVYQMPHFFPTPESEAENMVICVSGTGSNKPFHCMMTNILPCLDLIEKTQCFPFYTYAEDGSNRTENITDWALEQFREQYGPDVSKRDIFHYVYALLHHPQYREKYAENLKRELPRVPLVDSALTPVPSPHMGRGVAEGAAGGRGEGRFGRFTAIGEQLAQLHLGYETAEEYPLRWVENKEAPWSWRVEKMKLSKDKSALVVNPSLTLEGIPPEAFAYKLGNRSALEWVIDQYQVKSDARSGLRSDPNRADDPEYIARLVGRIVTVSVRTAKLVGDLPSLS